MTEATQYQKGQIFICDDSGTPQPTNDIDLFDSMPIHKISLYNGLGFVEILDVMPRRAPIGHNADLAIAQAAWVSFARHVDPKTGAVNPKEVDRIVRYLREHSHTSPSEMVEFKFRARVPIFVFQHLVRHRTASLNAESGRYIEMPAEAFLPELRMQSKDNKQGSCGDKPTDDAITLWQTCQSDVSALFEKYQSLIKMNVAKEVARTILPLGLMTSFVWKIDLHNLIHLLSLRLDSHTQLETREFADAVHKLISTIVPGSMQAFDDFQRNIVKFDAQEQSHIVNQTPLQERKKNKLDEKLLSIGISHH